MAPAVRGKLKLETGITNLKVRFNRVAGFYIEVSKAQGARVPVNFERRQTLVNAERFTHPELKAREEEILGAEDKLERKARELIERLADNLRAHAPRVLAALRLVAFVDAFAGAEKSIQRCAAYGPWVWPEVRDGNFYFSITEGRHPLIEARERTFVPNSLALGVGKKRLLLLTGPNMAGKSTLMRQCGLILLLGQVGLRAPADACEFAPASGFYSRMGASDRILMGESTFMVEMREMSTILRDADANSFVLIDEIGRGTSTKDGLALAKSFLEFFAFERPAITLFATHYHELAGFCDSFASVVNASMTIKEWKGDLVFLRKLIYEAASSSYGIHVAKLAGIPTKILNRAKTLHKMRVDLEIHETPDLPLFTQVADRRSDAWEQKIESIDLDEISPREAWRVLEQWKKEWKQDDKNSAAHD